MKNLCFVLHKGSLKATPRARHHKTQDIRRAVTSANIIASRAFTFAEFGIYLAFDLSPSLVAALLVAAVVIGVECRSVGLTVAAGARRTAAEGGSGGARRERRGRRRRVVVFLAIQEGGDFAQRRKLFQLSTRHTKYAHGESTESHGSTTS